MASTNEKAFDLVCGMELNLATITHAVERKGETYYFCSASCKKHFEENPKQYLGE